MPIPYSSFFIRWWWNNKCHRIAFPWQIYIIIQKYLLYAAIFRLKALFSSVCTPHIKLRRERDFYVEKENKNCAQNQNKIMPKCPWGRVNKISCFSYWLFCVAMYKYTKLLNKFFTPLSTLTFMSCHVILQTVCDFYLVFRDFNPPTLKIN